MSGIWNVAHRGASAERPENTLAAARLAIAQGADVIEADVRLTSDGELVVIHDETVDRTTTGSGPVRSMTLEELRRLDAGQGETVPTAREVLETARGRVRVNLDVKEVDAALPALELVRELGMVGSVTFISFLPEVWDLVAERGPDSPVVHLVASAQALAGVAMAPVGSRTVAAGVGVPHALVTREVVEMLHRQGTGVFAWTVDDPSEMRRLVETGVNGIVTKRPDQLRRVLEELGVTRR